MMKIKFWIARDEGIYLEEDDRKPQPGKLHIFYDTPEILYDRVNNNKYFGNARVICEIPSYMFPEIKEGTCLVISDIETYIEEDWTC